MMTQLFHSVARVRGLFAAGAYAALATQAALVALTAAVAPLPAHAVIGAGDNVPASTLLLPYFEIDLNDGNGPQTSIRLSNTSASATMANVTLWTDWGIPTKSFNIYVVGYDTSEIDLRLVFKGHLPRTATAGQDPTDRISPKGPLSQDINFATCNGILPYTTLLPPAEVTALRNAHTGLGSATFGGSCGGKNYGDGLARGYVTIDVTNACTLSNPTTAGYFVAGGQGIAGNRNILTASSTTIVRAQNSATTDPLVHIEASATNPISSTSGQPTFYGSLVANTAIDNREPLGTVWNARYLNGGTFTGGTGLTVWQDPGQPVTPVACGNQPAPFPLILGQVAAFDEQEHPALSPPPPVCPFCPPAIPNGAGVGSFPVVAQQIDSAILSPFASGHLILNFNQYTSFAVTTRRQSFVGVQHDASGRFSASTGAVRMFSADQAPNNQMSLFQ